VDALRALMIQGGTSMFGMQIDFAAQLLAFAVLGAIATRLYPTIIT
jgi:hypothetical protein